MDVHDKIRKFGCMAALTVLLVVLISGCGKPLNKDSEKIVNNNQPGKVKQIGVTNGEGWFRVKRVVDGDTFIVEENNERVRLIGINAPESAKPQENPQPFGREASRYLNKKLTGQEVKLVFDVAPRDKYGRLLAYVYLHDGSFINAIMLKEGYAQVMTVPPNVAHAKEFLRLQREARLQGKGLWGISDGKGG